MRAYAYYTDKRTEISDSRKAQIIQVLNRIDKWLKKGAVMQRQDIVLIMTKSYTVSGGKAPTFETHCNHLAAVKQFAKHMFGRRLFNKMSTVAPSVGHTPVIPDQTVFHEKILALLSTGDYREAAYLALAICTGLRHGDQRLLLWSQIEQDYAGNPILDLTAGKTGKAGKFLIDPVVYALLNQYRKVEDNSPSVWPKKIRDDKHVFYDWIDGFLAIKDFRPHTTRKVCATYVSRLTGNESACKRILQHNPNTVSGRYDLSEIPAYNFTGL